MQFRTEIGNLRSSIKISHCDVAVLIGSCFTDNIGARLRDSLFDVVINPFGTSYNPLSISRQIMDIVEQRRITDDDLFFSEGRYHSFDFHSSFSGADKNAVLLAMNRSIASAHEALKCCKTLIITFGTAWAFTKDGVVVNNCHKMPGNMFSRDCLAVSDVVDAIIRAIDALHGLNSDVKVILTVSPIRHIADTLAGNALSKSILRVAIDTIVKHYGENAGYFPSYEIMLDDLRDYRFYAADMVHPSDVAIDYIFERFLTSHCTEADVAVAAECRKLTRLLAHRPMTDSAEALARLQQSRQNKIAEAIDKYEYLSSRIARYAELINTSI